MSTNTRQLIADARYEVIPMKNLEAQIPHLPAGCSVSVTCSPAKGQQATLDLTARLLDLGYIAVPHLSARLTEDDVAVKKMAEFCRSHGVQEVFLVAGDPPEPAGPYDGVVAFLRDFLGHDHGLRRIGVTAYPDGHALIPHQVVHEALHGKQALLAEAGVDGFASTQMCFDVSQWKQWAAAERAAGFTLPLHIGVPGVIDRTKLLTMGMRLGIGASMRFVKKQGGVLGRLFSPGGYDPMKLLQPLGKAADTLGVEGTHLFTFNNVEATAEWQQRMLAKLQ
ncbi:MAG TPA: 5,10-methylenetetrahydrofolate reductase [Acidimicrobiaceae bacterium]|nr:5,10-methylenetetrahydrofolate reductase [Acidimicrobiaceae bacterium]